MAWMSCAFCGKTFDAKGSAKTCSADCARERLREYGREYKRQWRKDPATRERMLEYKRQYNHEKRGMNMFCGAILAAQVLPKVFKDMGEKNAD